jgi:HSP20 family protein
VIEMNVIRWNPWNEMFALHNQMDELFNSVARSGPQEVSHLPLDIRRTEDGYLLEASVPGFAPEQVEITVNEGMLTIRGQVEATSERDGARYIRRERRVSSFYRQVTLPSDVETDRIEARFEHGVLSVTLPCTPKTQPRRIPVTSGHPAALSTTVVDGEAAPAQS